MFSVIGNTVRRKTTGMSHFTHHLIKIEAVSHDEVVWNDEPTVIALETITQRRVLFAKYASLE